MKSYTRIRARIDLDAIEYNIEKMKENLPEDTKPVSYTHLDVYKRQYVSVSGRGKAECFP